MISLVTDEAFCHQEAAPVARDDQTSGSFGLGAVPIEDRQTTTFSLKKYNLLPLRDDPFPLGAPLLGSSISCCVV
jgi:hypothetical protein